MGMKKEACVLIIEADTYARSWMALLLARDWRTSIVGEISTLEEAPAFFSTVQAKKRGTPNLILLDVEPVAHALPGLLPELSRLPGAPSVLLIGETVEPRLVEAAVEAISARASGAAAFPGFLGYLLKHEIRHSLAWAIALAEAESWVITPALAPFFRRLRGRSAQRSILVLKGDRRIPGLTNHDVEMARLALIFSMERGDMSDEIKVSKEWVYGLVSALYKKMGMEELVNGETDPSTFLNAHLAQMPQVREVLREAATGKNKKGKDLETLAYHILTEPDVEPLD